VIGRRGGSRARPPGAESAPRDVGAALVAARPQSTHEGCPYGVAAAESAPRATRHLPAKRDTVSSRRWNLRNRQAGDIAALKGPTFRTVNPVGVGWSGGFCYPQVKTCGYSTLAPWGPNAGSPVGRPVKQGDWFSELIPKSDSPGMGLRGRSYGYLGNDPRKRRDKLNSSRGSDGRREMVRRPNSRPPREEG